MKLKDYALKLMEDLNISKVSHSSVYFSSGGYTPRKNFMKEYFNLEYLAEHHPEMAQTYITLGAEAKRKYPSRALEHISKSLEQKRYQLRDEATSGEMVRNLNLTTDRFDFKEYAVFKSFEDADYTDKLVVFDLVERKLSKINPEQYIDSLPPDIRKEFRPLQCIFEYNPYDLSPVEVIDYDRQKINKVNLYKPPAWRLDESPLPPNSCPPVFATFFKTFLPEKTSRLATLGWVKNLILTRPQTYLTLNGQKGIGKNIFTDLLVELVGRENYSKGKDSLLSKEFNSPIFDKRLVVLDEIKVNKAKHTVLKDFINESQSKEAKGVDTAEAKEIYCGYVISNNDIFDMYLEWDDRRFSLPELTDVPLRDSLGSAFIENELVPALANPKLIRQLGLWILAQDFRGYEDPFYAFKGAKFHSLVYTSLHAWQQYLAEKMLAEDFKDTNLSTMKISAEADEIMFPTTYAKVLSFLRNYRHEGVEFLGSLVKVGKSWKLTRKAVDDEDDL